MTPALRTLLDEVLDYSGVFPPAGLPLGQALQNYAGYRASPRAWLLARFVCSAQQLVELGPLCAALPAAMRPVRLAVAGQQDPLSPESILDVRAIHHFTHAHGQHAKVEALELRVPGEKLCDWTAEAVSEALDVLATDLVKHDFRDVEVFLEPTGGPSREETARSLVAALSLHDEQRGQPDPERIGFKLRMGGPDASAFPSIEQAAIVLSDCCEAGIPLKFTAGLHRPLRWRDDALRSEVHGYLNLLAAGVLAHASGLSEMEIRAVLGERESTAFTFGRQGLRWREREVTLEEIETARDEFVLCISSCSFDEPAGAAERLAAGQA
jgi:hypothetical protein